MRSTTSIFLFLGILLSTAIITSSCTKDQYLKVLAAFMQIDCNGITEVTSDHVLLDPEGYCTTAVDISFEDGQWVYFCIDGDEATTYPLGGGYSYATLNMNMFSEQLYSNGGSLTFTSLDKEKETMEGTFDFTVSDPFTCGTVAVTGTFSIRKNRL